MKKLFSSKIFHLKSSYIISAILAFTQMYVIRFHFETDLGTAASLAVFVVSFCIFLCLLVLLDRGLHADWDIHRELLPVRKNRIWLYALLIFVCWIPHLIMFFPGSVTPDMVWQTAQSLGLTAYSLHHPIFNTYFMGLFIRLGRLLFGSSNAGLFLFILFQNLFSAFVLGYVLKTMKDCQAKNWMMYLSFLLFVLMPDYTGFVNVAVKDTIFSFSFLLFMTCLLRILVLKDHSKSLYVLWVIGVLGTLLMRNNGAYVFYPTMVCFFIYCLRKKELRTKMVVLWLCPVLLSGGINKALEYRYTPLADEKGSALSLPLQQTARYVKLYGDEVTDEEKKAIDTVIEYDALADAYTPYISDPVKNLYREETGTKELVNYLKTWFSMFLKHPEVYIDATAEQNYYLFDYFDNSNNYYSMEDEIAYLDLTGDELYEICGFEMSDSMIDRQIFMENVYNFIDEIPVVRLFNSPSVYVLLSLFLIVFACMHRNGNYGILLIPIILSVLVLLAGPLVKESQRYELPIIYSIPLLYSCFFIKRNTDKN